MPVINTAKRKMLEGKPVFGYALGLGSPLVAELLAGSGIDFILLDRQHGSFGEESTIASFAMMHQRGAIPMARVAQNNYTQIGRLLDEGALGIIVPMVDTPEQAQAAAEACRLPPVGRRSWGWGRAANYGSDYAQWINDELFVAVQIESALAVQNAEAILATPGVDGCWIGPGDLSLSMGYLPGSPEAAEPLARAVETVLQACRNTGKISGYASNGPEHGIELSRRGLQFITAGSDIQFLKEGASAALELFRRS